MIRDPGAAGAGRLGRKAGRSHGRWPLQIAEVGVVIPVHNEEQHLRRALGGVRAAADALQDRLPVLRTRIMVVLDSCTDNSGALAAAVAASDPRISLLQVAFRSVGRSRHAGISAILAGRPPGPAASGLLPAGGRLWLANTDADSCVPADWLVRQVELADRGADAVLGTVEPDPEGMEIELLRRWHARHPLGEGHPHIFGANMGVRGSAYALAGGFPRRRSHEDRVLVERLRRCGCRITSTDTLRVLTSGRTEARAPEGFGAYLLALGREPALALDA